MKIIFSSSGPRGAGGGGDVHPPDSFEAFLAGEDSAGSAECGRPGPFGRFPQSALDNAPGSFEEFLASGDDCGRLLGLTGSPSGAAAASAAGGGVAANLQVRMHGSIE